MRSSEAIEQANLVRWSHRRDVRERFPELKWLYHTPNGGLRDKVSAGQMVALGVKRGVPDLTLPIRRGDAAGLVIEMKSDDGRLSREQEEWLAHYEAQGWKTAVCRSARSAAESLLTFLTGVPTHYGISMPD